MYFPTNHSLNYTYKTKYVKEIQRYVVTCETVVHVWNTNLATFTRERTTWFNSWITVGFSFPVQSIRSRFEHRLRFERPWNQMHILATSSARWHFISYHPDTCKKYVELKERSCELLRTSSDTALPTFRDNSTLLEVQVSRNVGKKWLLLAE
jgi:hypothetical protein